MDNLEFGHPQTFSEFLSFSCLPSLWTTTNFIKTIQIECGIDANILLKVLVLPNGASESNVDHIISKIEAFCTSLIPDDVWPIEFQKLYLLFAILLHVIDTRLRIYFASKVTQIYLKAFKRDDYPRFWSSLFYICQAHHVLQKNSSNHIVSYKNLTSTMDQVIYYLQLQIHKEYTLYHGYTINQQKNANFNQLQCGYETLKFDSLLYGCVHPQTIPSTSVCHYINVNLRVLETVIDPNIDDIERRDVHDKYKNNVFKMLVNVLKFLCQHNEKYSFIHCFCDATIYGYDYITYDSQSAIYVQNVELIEGLIKFVFNLIHIQSNKHSYNKLLRLATKLCVTLIKLKKHNINVGYGCSDHSSNSHFKYDHELDNQGVIDSCLINLAKVYVCFAGDTKMASKCLQLCYENAKRRKNKRIAMKPMYLMIKFKLAFVAGDYNKCWMLYNQFEKNYNGKNCSSIGEVFGHRFCIQMKKYLCYALFEKWKRNKKSRLRLLNERYWNDSVQKDGLRYPSGDCTSLMQNDRNITILSNICSLKQCYSKKCNRKDVVLRICKGCKTALYCSKQCQKYDWKDCHAIQCAAVKGTKKKLKTLII